MTTGIGYGGAVFISQYGYAETLSNAIFGHEGHEAHEGGRSNGANLPW